MSKVTENGPAHIAGVRVGDKVLAVNGVSVIDTDHHDAVGLLKNAGATLVLLIERDNREVKRFLVLYLCALLWLFLFAVIAAQT